MGDLTSYDSKHLIVQLWMAPPHQLHLFIILLLKIKTKKGYYQYAHSVSQNGTCNFNPHFGVAYAYFFAKLVHSLRGPIKLPKETECV